MAKVLISDGVFPEKPLADNNISVLVAQEMKKRGHEVEIVGLTYDIEPSQITVEGITVYKIPFAKQIIMDARLNMKKEFQTDGTERIPRDKKIKFLLRHPVQSIAMKLNARENMKKYFTSDYTKEVKKLLKKGSYDTLMTVTWPFDKAEPLMNDKSLTVKKVYYQLDPFSMSQYPGESRGETDIAREATVFENVDAIVTTEELYAQYKEDLHFKNSISKIHAMRFPTLKTNAYIESAACPIAYDRSMTNLLFCGSMDDNARDPMPDIKILEQILKQDENIRMYFLGRFASKKAREYIEQNHIDRMIICDPVSQVEASSAIADADILVNISNTYSNMVPSKIFSYFESGNPILNFQKIDDCPSRKYFDMYPYALTVKDYESYDIDAIVAFIQENKGKKVDHDKVLKIYESNTPEYAAGVFDKLI